MLPSPELFCSFPEYELAAGVFHSDDAMMQIKCRFQRQKGVMSNTFTDEREKQGRYCNAGNGSCLVDSCLLPVEVHPSPHASLRIWHSGVKVPLCRYHPFDHLQLLVHFPFSATKPPFMYALQAYYQRPEHEDTMSSSDPNEMIQIMWFKFWLVLKSIAKLSCSEAIKHSQDLIVWCCVEMSFRANDLL